MKPTIYPLELPGWQGNPQVIFVRKSHLHSSEICRPPKLKTKNSLGFAFRWVMRCEDSYHGNIPGRFSWVEIWWNFLWFKKTHEFLDFQKKTPKAENGIAAYALRKPATLWNVGSPRLIWFCTFSCTFWRSSQDDSNMCKHFLWIDGFFLCYHSKKKTNFSLSGYRVASSNASTWTKWSSKDS